MDIASKVKQLFTKEKLLSKKTFFILLLLVDLYVTLSTVLKASSYSFMITDDFHDAVLVRDMFEGGLLLRTLKVVYMRYMTHAGAFTCFFTTPTTPPPPSTLRPTPSGRNCWIASATTPRRAAPSPSTTLTAPLKASPPRTRRPSPPPVATR